MLQPGSGLVRGFISNKTLKLGRENITKTVTMNLVIWKDKHILFLKLEDTTQTFYIKSDKPLTAA